MLHEVSGLNGSLAEMAPHCYGHRQMWDMSQTRFQNGARGKHCFLTAGVASQAGLDCPWPMALTPREHSRFSFAPWGSSGVQAGELRE